MDLKPQPKKLTTVSARLTQEMKDDVEKILNKYDISWGSLIRSACEELLKENPKD